MQLIEANSSTKTNLFLGILDKHIINMFLTNLIKNFSFCCCWCYTIYSNIIILLVSLASRFSKSYYACLWLRYKQKHLDYLLCQLWTSNIYHSSIIIFNHMMCNIALQQLNVPFKSISTTLIPVLFEGYSHVL